MVHTCWVRDCRSRAKKTENVRFYSIPKVREHEGDFTRSLCQDRRRLWLANINREDEPTKFSKICSLHFIKGRPSSMYERYNPDWAPTLNLGGTMTRSKTKKKRPEVKTKLTRIQKAVKSQGIMEQPHDASAPLELQDNFQLTWEDPTSFEEPVPDEGLADARIDSEPSDCSNVPVLLMPLTPCEKESHPGSTYERSNPNWAPTLKLGRRMTPAKSKKKQVQTKRKRIFRAMKRRKTKKRGVATAPLELQDNFQLVCDDPISSEEPVPHESLADFCIDSESSDCTIIKVTQSQADNEVQRLLSENLKLHTELESLKLTQASFQNNNEKVKYYTGLPNFENLMLLFNIVSPFVCTKNKHIGVFERLLMTLMRLKLNLSVKDLAYRFNTSVSTVSRIFSIITHILYVRLGFLIYWPEREELQKTMPVDFQIYLSKKTAVIIDCFEICIQRPEGLMARAQTWSNSKDHSTVKYLIGITPQGSVSFISDGWGGRTPDKFMTEQCGILNKLLPGDLVLANCAFDGSDSVGLHCAEINVPIFTGGKPQLSGPDLETTQKIAHVRTHVERVIGLVQNKYTVLQGKLPMEYLMSKYNGVPFIDKITTVCCALTNMCESVVSFH